MKQKIITLFVIFCSLWMSLIIRSGFLQFVPHQKLNSLKEKQFQTVVALPARRGNIVDRYGQELAMSQPSYSLYADPKIIKDKKLTAKILSKILKTQLSKIFTKIKDSSKQFVWIDRLITVEQMEQIKKVNIRGLGFVEDWKRVYPNNYLLSSTLGFTGKEGHGLEGIELAYDKELKGHGKTVTLRKDARGRPLIQDGLMFTETPFGKEIRLTIDADLQYFVETELKQAVEKFNAVGAYAVVLDAQTSAIRAITSYPHFDLNNPQAVNSYQRRNRSVTDTFEPGSTLKTFILASAIDQNLYQPNSKIFCENGHFKIGKRVIKEAEKNHAQGLITLSEVLAYSSNIGTSKVALKLGDQNIRESLYKFGFGQKQNLDLPGEAKGIMLDLPWRDHLLANISFGQGITTSPLQIANAYAVIANGGVLNSPYIVESMYDPDTQETTSKKSQLIRRVISSETAKKMRMMLVGVTTGKGSGVSAQVNGYLVGGKTGTAQKVKPNGRGYIPGGYIASFTGFIPANDPKYVIFVAIDEPQKTYYGSQVAAPLFSTIASYAVRKTGVAPEVLADKDLSVVPTFQKNEETQIENLTSLASDLSVADPLTVAPDLTSLSLRESMAKVTGQNIKIKSVGKGVVVETIPAAGSDLGDKREMLLILK